jgi:hypothetical protein
MIWLKCILVGLGAALATVIAIVIATSVSFISVNQGSGSIGAVSFGVSELLLLPAVLAFALGFRWMFRRQRRRLANESKETHRA